jgi:hypothetical protein
LRLGRERHELGGEGVDLFESPAAQTSGQQVILAPGE